MKPLYSHPSFYAHIMNGLLVTIALIIVFMNFDKVKQSHNYVVRLFKATRFAQVRIFRVKSFGTYELLIIVLLFATVVGIHGISHLGLEQNYDYYPLPWVHNNVSYNVV